MSKIAFIFPGQGAQYIGMAKEIADEYASSNEIFEMASKALGFDIKKMIFDGTDEELKLTENTQPAILTASIACLQPLLEKGIVPSFVAGLSLGEYSAHVAAGSICFEDAVALVRKRGKFMQEAVPEGVGTMAAILGLDAATVVECLREASSFGIVEPANYNCPGQIVIAGAIPAVEMAVEIAKSKGAKRAIILPVSAPFHCSLLKPAGERLSMELDKLSVLPSLYPVVSNVTASIVTDSSQIKPLLKAQVSTSVRWEESVRLMLEQGVDTFIEIGPGKVLSGFIKKIDKNIKMLNVEDLASLRNTLDAI